MDFMLEETVPEADLRKFEQRYTEEIRKVRETQYLVKVDFIGMKILSTRDIKTLAGLRIGLP